MRLTEYHPPYTGGETDGRNLEGRLPASVADQASSHAELQDRYGELRALAALGFAKPFLTRHAAAALKNGTTIEAEILSNGGVEENAYYGAIARLLRLPFLPRIPSGVVANSDSLDLQLARPSILRLNHRHRRPEMAIVPQAGRLADIAAALVAMPSLGRDLVVTTPSAVRTAVWEACAGERVREASRHLFERVPDFSARIVLTGSQGLIAGTLISLLICAIAAAPSKMLLILHAALSLFYLASLLLKGYAACRKARSHHGTGTTSPEPVTRTETLPRYTILVALYQEAAVAQQLVASLSRIDWPKSLLEIKLVCETLDEETIAALRAALPGPHFEIVRVPAHGPRTKPKALTYAMAGATGEFLAIYDAEDRPHPQQLREAYRKFRASPDNLACLQAPLIINNAAESWLSALFSMEYSGLFRRLLPMLGKAGMPMPLGGTSNHFRTAILREVGGWDPYNVTEDADLGLRLYRLGYRSDVISRHTTEDAPVELRVWMAQRTRWYKGWLQTWLVLMRDPPRLVREIGLRPFLVFQLLIGGMLASALLHPLIIAFVAMSVSAMLEEPTEVSLSNLVLFGIDFVNILGSYLLFLALGLGAMIKEEKRRVGHRWLGIPFYWLLVSAAAWRAVIELKTKPFHWNKTPHRPSGKIKTPS